MRFVLEEEAILFPSPPPPPPSAADSKSFRQSFSQAKVWREDEDEEEPKMKKSGVGIFAFGFPLYNEVGSGRALNKATLA